MNQTFEANPNASESRLQRPFGAFAPHRAWGALLTLLFLVWGGLSVLRGRSGETMFGGTGGDSIGSLPLMSAGGPGANGSLGENLVGPVRPAFSLTGTQEHLLAAIVEAFPTGADAGYAVVPLPDGRLRLEFYGRVTVVLDHARLMSTPVTGQIRIGSSFQGGVASLEVGGQIRQVQALPLGLLPLPLQQLSSSGVLQLGMVWHAVSLQSAHRVLEIKKIGERVRVEQRD